MLPTPTIWFPLDSKQKVSDTVVSRVRRNGNILILLTDSVVLMTALTTLIFDFHYVISALTTPLMTPSLSQVKTSLKMAKVNSRLVD